MKHKLLYISGHVAEYPKPLRPLPPLDSGAPHSNMFRLTEFIAQNYSDLFSVNVISPCNNQYTGTSDIVHNKDLYAIYHQVSIPEYFRKISFFINKTWKRSSSIFRKFFYAPSFQGFYYLQKVKKFYEVYMPDFVIHDDGPQYIKGLSRFVPRNKLYFYCRADMGSSRKDLNLPVSVIVTNQNVGDWVKSINPNVVYTPIVPNSLSETFENVSINQMHYSKKSKSVVFVGRIVPEKGIKELIIAFSEVYKKFRNPLILDIVGAETPSNYLSYSKTINNFEMNMRKLASKLLPENAIRWHGWVSQEELIKIFQNASVAVFPSLWMEGFGMVALEAMACGVPVVCSKRPGFESLLARGGGVLVDPEDLQEISRSILRILVNQEYACRLGEEGYKESKKYNIKSSAQELTRILINNENSS